MAIWTPAVSINGDFDAKQRRRECCLLMHRLGILALKCIRNRVVAGKGAYSLVTLQSMG